MESHILTLMTFIPLLGAFFILFVPKGKDNVVKIIAAVFTFIPVILAVKLFFAFDRTLPGVTDFGTFQFIEKYPWIKAFNIEYFMGVDGISVPMVLLTALLSFLAVVGSWNIDKQVKGYFALFLLLETGMMGVFCALDFFLFYVFWEVMLLPMYFLIGIWGGPRREYAAIKFFLYTLLGSVLMLLVILALYFNTTDPETGRHTFNMLHYMNQSTHNAWLRQFDIRVILFIALFIGFAIKVPIFPFHTWLPDAHVEAPTAISVILAGVLLKMGTYGILRISYPIFPDVTRWFAIPLAILGVINILYGALCAMAQSDLKKLVAYSSISHMGYVCLGMAAMTPAGINGAVFQMFNHGTITAMLFFLVGVVYDRAHHREIDGFGGLGAVVPVYTAFVSLAFFASLGLPGLSGFISEALVFIGSFPVFQTMVIIATAGIVFTAAYHLWALQRIFLGPVNPKYVDLPEINAREIFCLTPLAIIVMILGVYPMPVLKMINTSLLHLIDFVKNTLV
ncbi:MAG: NADH-quinone oxidoreductase subunit M [Deltaproteobacteria bacterium]|nr:MAG: NADH-quinone oxidoreductase subunit M [Deltaproteobacteria bacterium]